MNGSLCSEGDYRARHLWVFFKVAATRLLRQGEEISKDRLVKFLHSQANEEARMKKTFGTFKPQPSSSSSKDKEKSKDNKRRLCPHPVFVANILFALSGMSARVQGTG